MIVSTAKEFIKAIEEAIKSNVMEDINTQLVLDAYNYWCEQERDGAGYIFNLANNEDVKYLFNNDSISVDQLVSYRNDGVTMIMGDDLTDQFNRVSRECLAVILESNAYELAKCMVKYIGRCGNDSPYEALYEAYVTEVLERGDARL